nr:hypothetical transcript [Hymenolepis microstoma]
MYPFNCWLRDKNDCNTNSNTDIAFGSYKKWRLKEFTVTSRQMVVAGQNRNITGEEAIGRIFYASNQSGCVTSLSFSDEANSSSEVYTTDFIHSKKLWNYKWPVNDASNTDTDTDADADAGAGADADAVVASSEIIRELQHFHETLLRIHTDYATYQEF